MKPNERLQTNIENVIQTAINAKKEKYSAIAITDLYIQLNIEKGVLSIYDDEDHLLHSIELSELPNEEMEDDEDMNTFKDTIKKAVLACNEKKLFDELKPLNPFSVILVDDSFETIEELLIIDNEQLVIDNELLENWEKDLDDFMTKIANDFE